MRKTMSTLGEAEAKEKPQSAGQLLIRSLVQQNYRQNTENGQHVIPEAWD
jgi:hypothetical protein